MDPVLMSAGLDSWMTPTKILALAARVHPIGLDPCAADDPRQWFAVANVTREGDGLSKDWRSLLGSSPGDAFPMVFVNPPYGGRRRILDKWAEKIVHEVAKGCPAMVLAPNRTDTKWWHTMMDAMDYTCEIRGRLKFRHPTCKGEYQSAPFPSVVMYSGPKRDRFIEKFGTIGRVRPA